MNIANIIKTSNLPIIIFGAAIAGEHTLNFCKENNIKVEFFCDNNPDKVGTSFCGLKVKSLRDIKSNFKDAFFLISIIDIQDIVYQLKKFDFNFWMSCNEILKDIHHNIVANMVISHDNYLNKDILFIRGIDVMITERCSLKCKDCSNLMSYYENPKDYDISIINKNIENLCNNVDKIGEVRIIGGEPFMHKDINLVIKPLLNNDKVNSVVIYTNATFLPTEEQLTILRHEKIFFYVSDYGKISKKFNKLCELLTKEGIEFITAKIKWTDCSIIKEFKRGNIENQKIFNDCCVKNLFTLCNNKLYRCPFFANADNLQAIPSFKDEYIDLSKKFSREDLKKYILNRKYLKVCDFCNGRSFDDEEIESAVQLKEAKPYKKYL